jgi:hypothetical protein
MLRFVKSDALCTATEAKRVQNWTRVSLFFFFFEQLLHVLYEVSTLIFREGSSLLQVLHPSHLPCNLH